MPRSSLRPRLTVGVAVLVLIVLGGAVVALIASAHHDREPASSGPSAATGHRTRQRPCLPWTQSKSPAAINAAISRVRQVPGFLGADVGASAVLQDKRSVWMFADTLRDRNFSGPRFVRNSMLIFSPGCARIVMPTDLGPVIPNRADGVGYWPMSVGVIHLKAYDVVGVGVQRVRATGTGVFDFENLGPGLALFKVPVGGTPQLLAVHDIGKDDPSRARPTWGAAIATVGDEIYIYGTSTPEGNKAFGYSLRVARTKIVDVLDHPKWRYWDGRRWQRDASKAAALIPAVRGVSQVLSVFHRGGSWYAVSKRDEFLGTDLVIWNAPRPTGPFVPSRPLAQIPSNSRNGLLRYMPLAHPELPTPPGQVIVSYSRNVSDLQRLYRDPTLYRPKVLEVPLP